MSKANGCSAMRPIKARSYAFRLGATALLLAVLAPVHAAPAIISSQEASYDGPIKYTVEMRSENFGNEEETRVIRSGQSDDLNWQGSAPANAPVVPAACPGLANIARNAVGAAVRQVQVRLTSIVAKDGTANIQITFRGYVPQGEAPVNVGGKTISCPKDRRLNQVIRFSMSTATGFKKTITLSDGTKLTITTSRK